jgi:hypothetical protein
MTAEARLGLVKGHIPGLGEKPRNAEPRNAAADDGDPQRTCSVGTQNYPSSLGRIRQAVAIGS